MSEAIAGKDPSALRTQEFLYALSNLAEQEGRMDAALALAKWADDLGPFVPYSDAEVRAAQG